jgi:hypothetical protein
LADLLSAMLISGDTALKTPAFSIPKINDENDRLHRGGIQSLTLFNRRNKRGKVLPA